MNRGSDPFVPSGLCGLMVCVLFVVPSGSESCASCNGRRTVGTFGAKNPLHISGGRPGNREYGFFSRGWRLVSQ